MKLIPLVTYSILILVSQAVNKLSTALLLYMMPIVSHKYTILNNSLSKHQQMYIYHYLVIRLLIRLRVLNYFTEVVVHQFKILHIAKTCP